MVVGISTYLRLVILMKHSCVVMHTTVNSRPAVIVLLGEPSTQARNNDATNLLGWLSNLPKRI